MTTGPRDRLTASAIHLVRQRGVEGTGLKELVEHSGAARRSIYQHFPGGKTELIAHSTQVAGEFIRRRIKAALTTAPPVEALSGLLGLISATLPSQDFALGCPVSAAAQAVPEAEILRAAAAAAFSGWIDELSAALVRNGETDDDARSLAGFIVSAIEGALIRARAERSTEALDQVDTQLRRLLAPERSA